MSAAVKTTPTNRRGFLRGVLGLAVGALSLPLLRRTTEAAPVAPVPSKPDLDARAADIAAQVKEWGRRVDESCCWYTIGKPTVYRVYRYDGQEWYSAGTVFTKSRAHYDGMTRAEQKKARAKAGAK